MVKKMPKFMQKLLDQFKSQIWIKYLIALVLIFVPLYPKFPLFNIPGTYVAVRFEDLIMLILGVLTLVSVLKNIKLYLINPIFRSVLLFIFIGVISVLSGSLITKSISPHLGVFHLVRRIEYFIPFFAVLALIKRDIFKKSLNYYLIVIISIVFTLFVYGLGQRYYSFPIIITQNGEYSKGVALRYTQGSHINSTFAGHYDLASYMVLILPILITLIFTVKNNSSKPILVIASFLGLWLLVNSLSRIAQLSYLVSVSVALISIKKYKELLLVGLLSSVIIASSSGLYQRFSRFFTVYAADEVVIPVEKSTEVFEDRSTNIRLVVEWPRALRALSKNPMLGTGYSSINLATDNDYLRSLGETGVLGFLSFLLIIFNISKIFIKAFPFTKNFSEIELGLIAGVFGATIGTLITAVFIDIFEASKFAISFWLILGMAVFTIENRLNDQKN